jgi:hypothetical protein
MSEAGKAVEKLESLIEKWGAEINRLIDVHDEAITCEGQRVALLVLTKLAAFHDDLRTLKEQL